MTTVIIIASVLLCLLMICASLMMKSVNHHIHENKEIEFIPNEEPIDLDAPLAYRLAKFNARRRNK